MDTQRLRNLTTGRLHTEIGHLYEDLGEITGQHVSTHMLPRVMDAVKPWLQENVAEPRYWDGEYDTSHTGEYELPQPTDDDRAAMFERFQAMPNPLADKSVIAVHDVCI